MPPLDSDAAAGPPRRAPAPGRSVPSDRFCVVAPPVSLPRLCVCPIRSACALPVSLPVSVAVWCRLCSAGLPRPVSRPIAPPIVLDTCPDYSPAHVRRQWGARVEPTGPGGGHGAAMSEAAAVGPIDDSPLFEATRRRLTARQAEVVRQLVEATEAEAHEVGYSGPDRPVGGPPGRRGTRHRLHLLRLEGPPAGRGALAADAVPSPRRRVRPDAPCTTAWWVRCGPWCCSPRRARAWWTPAPWRSSAPART